MAAQVSANISGDALLYGFLPGVPVVGGSAAATASPLTSPRRLRTQSVAGEMGMKIDAIDLAPDLLASPRAASTLQVLNRPSTGGGLGMRVGSADRHHLVNASNGGAGGSGGGAMPLLVPSSVGAGGAPAAGGIAVASSSGGGAPPLRPSLSGGSSSVGLPKLDLPPTAYGSIELPSIGMLGIVRRSVNGTPPDSLASGPSPGPGALGMSHSESSLGLETTAPLSPRLAAPTVLAPLRSPGVLAAVSPSMSTLAPADGSGAGGGRRLSNADVVVGPANLSPSDLAAGVASPLTPTVPVATLPGSPRRSHSLTARRGVGPFRVGVGLGLSGDLDAAGGSPASSPAEGDHGDPNGPTPGSAAAMLVDINDDLQRAVAALLAVQGAAARPRSASAAPSAVAAAAVTTARVPLSTQQLEKLNNTAPELHAEVRVAVRRAFQVMRQELTSATGTVGSGPGIGLTLSNGRQLGSGMHDCWATLDAFLEGTTDLTLTMLEELRQARKAGASLALLDSSSSSGVGGGGSSSLTGASLDTVRELSQLRAANQALQRQLDECHARLSVAEARATAAKADAAVAAAASAAGGGSPRTTYTGPGSPRPPASPASPPLERYSNTSPRRGKHARAQPARDEGGGGQGEGGSDGGAGGDAQPRSGSRGRQPPAARASGAEGAAGSSGGDGQTLPLRIDRAAVLARGPSYDEVVIEEDDSEEDLDVSNIDARRHILTFHSASFAEWARRGSSQRP